jgi:hypothetical protein
VQCAVVWLETRPLRYTDAHGLPAFSVKQRNVSRPMALACARLIPHFVPLPLAAATGGNSRIQVPHAVDDR